MQAILVLVLILLILAILLFWQASRKRKAIGLPGGRIIYSDTQSWNAVKEPLYDPDLGLTGKPDYLVEKNGETIPVEVKSRRLPSAPYDSHILQLAAYCLLVQRRLGKRPAYGIIHYTDGYKDSKSFAVDYTSALEDAIYDILADIRKCDARKSVDRSHESPELCAHCGYRSSCDQRLR